MRYNSRDLKRYLAPFLVSATADGQGNIYRYDDPIAGDIYSTICKYLDNCENIDTYEYMEHIAWHINGFNYGSLVFVMHTEWNNVNVITIYFESRDAENER